MKQKVDPFKELVNEIRTWLRALPYDVTDLGLNSNQDNDFIATLKEGIISQQLLVRITSRDISGVDIDLFSRDLGQKKLLSGLLITDKQVLPTANDKLSEIKSIEAIDIKEFIKRTWQPYFDSIISMIANDGIDKYYVDLKIKKQYVDEKTGYISTTDYQSLDIYIDEWLKEYNKKSILILGDFGTGKTWFTRHYAHRQLIRYLDNPINERFPLLVPLRMFVKEINAEQLINEIFLNIYKLPQIGSGFDILKEMNRRGKLLLILDGFDEMARQANQQTIINNFWEIARFIGDESKVIMTCRSEYFKSAMEAYRVMAGKILDGQSMLSRILIKPPTFDQLIIRSLGEDQIREIISKKFEPKRADIICKDVLSNTDIGRLATRPIFLDFLLNVLDDHDPSLIKNKALLYLYATNKLLSRNSEGDRTFIKMRDKLYFLCELSWAMIRTERLRMHYSDFPDLINTYFRPKIKDKYTLELWDTDLRTQTLLIRDAAGYYSFIHKSMAEFFVAFKFAAELDCLDETFRTTYKESTGKKCVIPYINAIHDLSQTFGFMNLDDDRMQSVCEFLFDMLKIDANKPLTLLTRMPSSEKKRISSR